MKKDADLKPPEEIAKRACKAAGAPVTEPVWANQGRLFVLFPRGHPVADGQYRITVVDGKSFKVVTKIGSAGGQLRLRPTAGEKKRSASGALLERICRAFPASQHIPPDRFANDPHLPALALITKTDIDSLLAEGQFGESLIVINPKSFEQFRRTKQTTHRVTGDNSTVPDKPTRLDYEKYLGDWMQQDDRRRALEHKRRIIWMILKNVASDDRRILVELLNHEDVSIRWATAQFLLSNPSLQDAKIVAALRSLARDKPAVVPDGSAMSLEQMRQHDLPSLAARVLMNWQAVEDATDGEAPTK